MSETYEHPFSRASWIDAPEVHDRSAGYRMENQYLRYFHPLLLDEPMDITVHITACESYQLYINGTVIGRGPAVGYRSRYYYDTYTISRDLLRPGRNGVAVLVYAPGTDTETVQGFIYDRLGLLFTAIAGQQVLVSDSSWLCSPAPEYTGASMVSKWGFYKEFFHADRVEPWKESDFIPDASWSSATIVAPAIDEDYIRVLLPLPVPRLSSTEVAPIAIAAIHENLGEVTVDSDDVVPCLYQDAIVQLNSGTIGSMPAVIFDFGTVVVGYPEIMLSCKPCIYEIWYGESLDLMRLDCVYATENFSYESFSRRSCRYLMVKCIAFAGSVVIKRLRIRQELYAYSDDRCFSCGDDLIQRIVDTSLHTLQVNTSYHFEDCPFREQALWVFDMRIMAQIVYYHFGDSDLVKKNLLQIFALQRDDGSIPATGPKDNDCNTIDFCYHLVGTLREYVCYSSDSVMLQSLSDALLALDRFLENFVSPTGLVHHEGVSGWGVFLDWSDKIEKAGMSVILNALYLRYLEDMVFLSDTWLHYSDELTDSWNQKIVGVRREMRARLFDQQTGLFVDTCTEVWRSEHVSFQGTIAALYAGLFTEEEIHGAIAFLQRDDIALPFGPSFYHLCFEALGALGYDGEILKHIRRFYSGMLERGATTWWEVFDPQSPDWSYPHPFLGNTPTFEMDWIPVSSSHGWSGVPAYAIVRYVLGIDLSALYTGVITISAPKSGLPGKVLWKVPLGNESLHLEAFWAGQQYCVTVLELPSHITVRAPGVNLHIREKQRKQI